MLNALVSPFDLVGRILLATPFVLMGLGHYQDQATLAEMLAPHGLPGNATLIVIALELGGAILLILGLLARFAALAMAVLTLLAAYFLHYIPGDASSYPITLAYASIAGGLLYVFGHGAGGFSLDAMLTDLDN